MYGYENDLEMSSNARVAVVGVGGAGCNVVTDLYDTMAEVYTIAVNTDKVCLHENCRADSKIYICKEVLKGNGARGDPVLGKKCADIHKEEIRDALRPFDYVFVITGLGGGTGSGATPVVIDAAASVGCEVFAIAIKPFTLEMRHKVVPEALARIQSMCPTLIVDNDMALKVMPNLTMDRAFRTINRSIGTHIRKYVSTIEREIACTIGRRSRDDDKGVDLDDIPLNLLMKA